MDKIVYQVGYFEVGQSMSSDDTKVFNTLPEALSYYDMMVKGVNEGKIDACWLDCARASEVSEDLWCSLLTYSMETGTDMLNEFQGDLTEKVLNYLIELYWHTPWC